MKELKICFMSKQKNIPMGIYVNRKNNSWFPIVYFRKSKYATKKEFETIIKYLKDYK